MSLPTCWNKYPAQELPLLIQQRSEWTTTKALKGLKILHNVPLTIETLIKVDCLVQAGADVTLTRTRFIRPAESETLHQMIKELNLIYIAEHEDLNHEAHYYDYVLDCGAQLFNVIHPRKGFVELTGSGTALFKEHSKELKVPAISIDDSMLKQLETFYGTADGFIRALQQFYPNALDNQKVVIFGYGKVGAGIVYGLLPFTRNIVVVDHNPAAIKKAQLKGLDAVFPEEKERLAELIKQSNIVVAAAGAKNSISDAVDPSLLHNKILANMSAEDDFGPEVPASNVLGEKQPLNFLLESPTLMRYLDPSFYAHNLAALLIEQGDYAPGYHALCPVEDSKIMSFWQQQFAADLSFDQDIG